MDFSAYRFIWTLVGVAKGRSIVGARTLGKIVDEEFMDEPRCFAFACLIVARRRGQPKSSSMRSSMSVDATRDKLNWLVALGRDLTRAMTSLWHP